jgi:hypothetical protein
MAVRFYTIGHSTRSIKEFVDLLHASATTGHWIPRTRSRLRRGPRRCARGGACGAAEVIGATHFSRSVWVSFSDRWLPVSAPRRALRQKACARTTQCETRNLVGKRDEPAMRGQRLRRPDHVVWFDSQRHSCRSGRSKSSISFAIFRACSPLADSSAHGTCRMSSNSYSLRFMSSGIPGGSFFSR